MVSRAGPWGKTKHRVVVHFNVAATHTDLKIVLSNRVKANGLLVVKL